MKLTKRQLQQIIQESIEDALNNEEELDEGFFNNMKTAGKTFFSGKGGSFGDRFQKAKQNYNTQNEYDNLSSLKTQLSDLLDKRMISPNTTVAQLVGGKYNNNRFGTITGMMGNRQKQMNHRM